jgi:hypothetical protein
VLEGEECQALRMDDQLGQLLTYLLGAQVIHFQSICRYPNSKVTPVLGVFLQELRVREILGK